MGTVGWHYCLLKPSNVPQPSPVLASVPCLSLAMPFKGKPVNTLQLYQGEH